MNNIIHTGKGTGITAQTSSTILYRKFKYRQLLWKKDI